MQKRVSIQSEINKFSFGTLFMASNLYLEKFKNKLSEEAYYQTLTRMCRKGDLSRISKGIYCRPQKTRFGTLLPNEKQIINQFTKNKNGVLIGYAFYNSIGLTTQIPKQLEIFSKSINEKHRTIQNVSITKYDLDYNNEVCFFIEMLDILNNYNTIEDIDNHKFLSFCKEFSKSYNPITLEYVLKTISYPKRTIAFLKNVLVFYGVDNSLSDHLSSLSNYKTPSMEEIYELTQQ